jgi:hypothetical protein
MKVEREAALRKEHQRCLGHLPAPIGATAVGLQLRNAAVCDARAHSER